MSSQAVGHISETITATVTTEKNSGWACVVMPDSGTIFGTRRAVKVAGTVDGFAFAATLLPVGDGTHMIPLRTELRAAVGKELGDEVTIHLHERLG